MKFIYYSLTVKNSLKLHLWYQGKYAVYDYFSDSKLFKEKLDWIVRNKTFYKISYRGNHIEKPMIVLIGILLKEKVANDIFLQKLQELNTSDMAPTKRLNDTLKTLDLKVDFYEEYLKLLSHPLMLDIETFDGRIYHNTFERLEIQSLLPPAKNQREYLSHLEIIFRSKAFQEVFQQKRYLLETFKGNFHIPVNETTTDAQLTESFYAKSKLQDAYSVFIPKKYKPFCYFLQGELKQLYDCYQSKNPKKAIQQTFGKNGAVTQLSHFTILSGASAPIGFYVENYNPKKSWSTQVKTKRYERAIRLDLTHIQSYIMLETVKDSYFERQLARVLGRWQSEPEHRLALNRLLYPIQGSMDTPFEHDLHTPRYAYSMRLVHNLLLVGLLKTLTDEGMMPISLNNEVIFFEMTNFNQKRFEECLRVLDVYFDYRFIENLIIKDTNNYTYFDMKTKQHVFRGASFNHHEGSDVTTNMDTPPIVDWVLQKMITENGDFDENLIFKYLKFFLEEKPLDTIKEFFMVPIYPIKAKFQYLFKGETYLEVTSAEAFYASTDVKNAWQYRQYFEGKKIPFYQMPAILEKYHIKSEKFLYEVEHSRLILKEIDDLQIENIDLMYYANLINREINLWR